MKIIDREMTVKEIVTDKSNHQHCQASFNSDGNITLRNYNYGNKNSDKIIVLSAEETQAIIQLFSRLSVITKNNTLPF
jgi:hypothetical protein